jgi:hypothetical protein
MTNKGESGGYDAYAKCVQATHLPGSNIFTGISFLNKQGLMNVPFRPVGTLRG